MEDDMEDDTVNNAIRNMEERGERGERKERMDDEEEDDDMCHVAPMAERK
jgi:hypothetical protein